MFSGGFKRSGLFGLIGVVVVAAIVVVIALTTGEGQSQPEGDAGADLRRDRRLHRHPLRPAALRPGAGRRRRAMRGAERAVAEGGGEIENPTTMEEPAALGGAGGQADRRRGDPGAQLDVGRGPAQPAPRHGRDAADLPHRSLDLPARKLRAAADRRAADRDRGGLRQRPRPRAGRRDGQRLREGRPGDGAARPRGDRAAAGQHRDARRDDGRASGRRSTGRWC